VKPLKALIDDLGGWPALGDSFDGAAFNFEDTLGRIRAHYETYAIIASRVGADDMDSTQNIMQVL